MKTSQCFSENVEGCDRERFELDSSLFSMSNEHNSASSNKDLDSTFAEDLSLAFKVKQPKRKMNPNGKNQYATKEEK